MAGGRGTRGQWALAALALAGRAALAGWPRAAELAGGRVEVATPASGLRGALEGLQMAEWGLSPYASPACHTPPLLLALFAPLRKRSALALRLPGIAADAVAAAAVYGTARHTEHADRAGAAAALYLWSPGAVLVCVAGSLAPFENCAVFLAVYGAASRRVALSAFSLAAAAYVGMHPALLAPPLVLTYVRASGRRGGAAFAAGAAYLALAALWGGALLLASTRVVQGLPGGEGVSAWDSLRHWIRGTYGSLLAVQDLTPNLGVFWYFFAEVLTGFRPFFLRLFHLHAGALLVPLGIVLHDQPLFFLYCQMIVNSLMKPYPSVGDAVPFLTLMPLLDQLRGVPLPRAYVALSVFVYAYCLAPVFWHLWINSGVANANFYYAITICHSAAHVLVLTASINAARRWGLARRSAAGATKAKEE